MLSPASTANRHRSKPTDNDRPRPWRRGPLRGRNLNRSLVIAYLGPPGTFSQEAALRQFGESCELLERRAIDEVFAAVETGRADHGVAPIENSTEGAVNNTQDCLIDSPALIIGEQVVPIEHHLLAREGAAGPEIATIASHPQSLAQCCKWLQAHYPGTELRECASNGQAARMAAEDDSVAAIAGAMASRIYRLRPLAESIQDQAGNRTRFAVLGRKPAPPGRRDKTSILVYAENRPGALFRVLEPFERLSISLSRLESRPSRDEKWEYIFFMDFEGHRQDARVKELFDCLGACTDAVKILGSYPARS